MQVSIRDSSNNPFTYGHSYGLDLSFIELWTSSYRTFATLQLLYRNRPTLGCKKVKDTPNPDKRLPQYLRVPPLNVNTYCLPYQQNASFSSSVNLRNKIDAIAYSFTHINSFLYDLSNTSRSIHSILYF